MSAILAGIYVFAMVTANLLVWWLGPWFAPINSFLLIGLDLTLRDVMQERFNRWQLGGIIIIGGLITWAINPAAQQIALASATAFILAALADWATYSALRRHPWLVRSNGSNVVGAAVDSIIFPTLAFGVFLPAIIALQFVAKVGGGIVWSFLMTPFMRPYNATDDFARSIDEAYRAIRERKANGGPGWGGWE